jgi:DNA-binding NarL/FixJ family response regulator
MLVEDHADFRDFMSVLLGREPDLEVVAQAGSLAEARNRVAAVRLDVVVLDLGLPDGNGADLIADLRGTNPGAAVLVLSASLDPRSLERANEAGADEIMDKLASPAEVLGTIRRLGG